MIKTFLKFSMVSALALSVARCELLPPNYQLGLLAYCSGENAPLCLFLALAVGGIAIGILGPAGLGYHYAVYSDARLKTDIHYLETLPNGVRVYAFRYKGSDEVFYGALAQELRKDKRFAHAVTRGKDGYYRVNYAKLGIKIAHGDKFRKAGEAAAKRAS